MNADAAAALARGLAPIVRRYVGEAVTAAVEPLQARIRELESRPVTAPRDGIGIVDAIKDEAGCLILTLSDGRTVKPGIRDGKDGTAGRDGVDGQDGTAGLDGKDGAPGERGEPGPAGKDGIDGKEGTQGPQGPPGEKGADGERGPPGKDGEPGNPGEPGKEGPQGLAGKDGVSGRDGIDGKEGAAGLAGKDGSHGRDGRDGIHGKDGRDGFGWEDFTEEVAEDGRTFIHRYARGKDVKEFRHTFAVVLDRGVFKEGNIYAKGDGATFGGSYWIAQTETADKPGTSETWRLSAKRGRDGKDGKVKAERDPKEPIKVG